eukprot:SM000212S06882  [mRNA]  locus=s212:26326:31149:+ [translate_table: standard]
MAACPALALAALCFLASCTELGDAAASVDVFRLVQYDVRGKPLGSRRAALNLYAASGLSAPGLDLARAVVVLRVRDLDLPLLKRVLQKKQAVGGIILILPRKHGVGCSSSNDKDAEGPSQLEDGNVSLAGHLGVVAELEELLVHCNSQMPVYFALENDHLSSVINISRTSEMVGKPASASNGGGQCAAYSNLLITNSGLGYKLLVASAEPKKVPTPGISNIQVGRLMLQENVNESSFTHIIDHILLNWLRAPSAVTSLFGRNIVTDFQIMLAPITDSRYLTSLAALFKWAQGWLYGLSGEGDSAGLPTIVIHASYDTFGAAPSLATGANDGGTGAVAVLELARLFSRLYRRSPKSKGGYNLLFGLTAGGPYNCAGTKQWLASLDQRVLETVELTVSLKSLGAGFQGASAGKLHLHVSKPPKDPKIKVLHDTLAAVAVQLGLEVNLVHKKINISDPWTFGNPTFLTALGGFFCLPTVIQKVAWEHEQFSRQRIVAGTLSCHQAAVGELAHSGGLTDLREDVDDVAVTRATKLVAEALGRLVYSHLGGTTDIFAEGSSLAVSQPFVSAWLDLLSSSPRVIPYLPKSAPIVTALHKELASHTSDAKIHSCLLDSSYVFYDMPSATLQVYQVASVGFDLLIMLGVGLYLGILYIVLHITTKGLDDFMGVVRTSRIRKVKFA